MPPAPIRVFGGSFVDGRQASPKAVDRTATHATGTHSCIRGIIRGRQASQDSEPDSHTRRRHSFVYSGDHSWTAGLYQGSGLDNYFYPPITLK